MGGGSYIGAGIGIVSNYLAIAITSAYYFIGAETPGGVRNPTIQKATENANPSTGVRTTTDHSKRGAPIYHGE